MKVLAIGWIAMIAVGCIVACGGAPQHKGFPENFAKENEITALWTQIRDWRREAHMDLDPTRQNIFQSERRSIPEARKVCPEAHPVPATCSDVCSLAENICDNAESICILADELGKDDEYAQDKCANAKASCSEAKQRCCNCSGGAS